MRIEIGDFIIKTYGPNALFDITKEISSFLNRAKAIRGLLLISVMGSTGSLVLIPPEQVDPIKNNELWALVPVNAEWKHEGNAYAHLRSTVLGTSITVPIRNGKPVLGRHRIYFIENQCYMARERHFYLVYIGE